MIQRFSRTLSWWPGCKVEELQASERKAENQGAEADYCLAWLVWLYGGNTAEISAMDKAKINSWVWIVYQCHPNFGKATEKLKDWELGAVGDKDDAAPTYSDRLDDGFSMMEGKPWP